MADRFWVGGTGTWNTSSTTNWSASSGGPSGASVPGAADNVFFDQATTYTVTLTGALNCVDFTVSAGTVTFASTGTLSIGGSMSLVAGTIWNATGAITFNATGPSKTITTNGVSIASSNISFNDANVGGAWTLGSAFTTTGVINVVGGTFNTGNFAVSCTQFNINANFTRSIQLGASTLTCNISSAAAFNANATGLTFNAGTSQINLTAATSGILTLGLTFYNVSFTSTAGAASRTISGANTFNNLSISASSSNGVTNVTFDNNQTINGVLTTTSTTGLRRVFIASSTYGIGWTLTCNSAASLTDADFRDIYVKGTAAPISGTRIGNRGNCRGITFSTPKTVYLNQSGIPSWFADNWAATNGGAVNPDNYPLPQDTAIINNTAFATQIIAGSPNALPTINMSARTNAFQLSFNNGTIIYGSIINGSGVSYSATGLNPPTFSGEGTKTITSLGKTIGNGIIIDAYGGTVQLADALNVGTGTVTVTNGTFNTAGFAVTATQLNSTNTNARTINLGASTVTLSISNTTSVNFFDTTGLTFNAGTSQITMTGSASSGISIGGAGVGLTFYNVTSTQPSATAKTTVINGSNTYNNLTFSAASSVSIHTVTIPGPQTISGTLTSAGAAAAQRVFIRSDTVGTQRTLTANSLVATDCDFRDIVISGAAAGSSPTRAGDCGNNLGITFPAPKTVYWNLAGAQSWSATAWAASSGGTPNINNFPLAQDTAVFDNTGAAGSVTFNFGWNIGEFSASTRTAAMSLVGSSEVFVHKDVSFGTNFTIGLFALRFFGVGTQNFFSNGVTFNNSVTINTRSTGSVVLTSAFNSNSPLTLQSGTFNAASYNVTAAGFGNNSTLASLYLGSGTWTITNNNSWNCSQLPAIYPGTATIVLLPITSGTQTFIGGGGYYSNVVIGGTTETGTTFSITGNNTFGQISSTKTVAHTIAVGTATTSIGRWLITGTAGNVVTVTSSGGNSVYIYGPAVTGVDYLALGTLVINSLSPGEFYAGANSTGTQGPINTAAPAPRTLYWVGGTGNWSDTTKWATSSGGAGGNPIPRSFDSVIFNSASSATSYTVTIDAGVTIARCASFTMNGPASGNVSPAGSVPIAFQGNVLFAATGVTNNYFGTMFLSGNSSYTFTTNGLSLLVGLTVAGIGSTWSLGSALLGAISNTYTVTYGTFSTSASGYAITGAQQIASNNRNIRAIQFNNSTITLDGGNSSTFNLNAINLTFNAGTSNIVCSSTSHGITLADVTTGVNFYNLSFTSASNQQIVLSGVNTYNNLTVTGRASIGIYSFFLSSDQTVNGTFTVTAGTSAAYRTFIRSNTFGTPRTLTCAAVSFTDVDFRDITAAGAAAPFTGTRLGDAKGNTNITFPAAKTVQWSTTAGGNWGAPAAGLWAATAGGTKDATLFPLAQDTAVFSATFPTSSTVTVNADYNIGTIDMSAHTSTPMTLATGTTLPSVYGNWINGTTTTLSGTGVMTFAGRGSQTITSAGRTFTQAFAIDTLSGSVTLQDALINSYSGTFLHASGTFNANNYSTTLSGSASSVNTANSNLRTLALGSGTFTLAGSNGWTATSTNLTVTGTGTISLTSASAKTFTGGGVSYSGITLNQGGTGTLTISGNNTFANISDTAVGATTISLAATTQRVGAFTAAGTAGNLLTITGTSAASPATLIYTGAGLISGLDYLAPTFVRAYATTSTWYAGDNSTNRGSLGWIFESSGGVVYAVYITESNRASDSVAAAKLSTYASSIAESNRTSDSIAARATFRSALSETARATDSTAATELVFPTISETARASDSTAARELVFPTISETANAADTVASKATFGSAVSDTVNATDSVSSQATFSSSASEQANASEIAAAVQTFNSSVSDTANASETNSATAALNGAVTATVNVADSSSSSAVLGSSVSNTVTVADTAAAAQGFGTNISEQTAASETIAAAQGFRTAISEQARASETNAAVQVFRSNASEQARTQDTVSSRASFGSALNESARAQDTVSSRASFGSALSESAAITDTASAAATFRTNIEDTVQALDSPSSSATFRGAVSDSARAQDVSAVAASTFNARFADTVRTLVNQFRGRVVYRSNVSDTARITDTPSSKVNFLGNVTESARALDSISVAQRFRTAIAESSQAANIFSAIQAFKSNIAETARTSETNTAKASFGSAVSNTVRASDAPSSKATFGSAVNNTVQISDSNVGFIRFPGSIAESVQVSDQNSAKATFAPRIAESARAQDVSAVAASTFNAATTDTARALDSVLSRQGFGANVSNTVNVSDSPSTRASFGGAVSETAKTLDVVSANAAFRSQVSNSVQVSDASSAAAAFGSNVSATVQVQDAAASSQGFGSSIAETARTSETTSSKQGFGSNISEFAAAQDAAVGRIQFPGSVVESVIAQDAAVGRIQFPGNVSESATAQDSITPALLFNLAVSESATVQDSTSSLRILPGRVSESARVQESVVASAIFRGIIDEAVRGSDRLNTSVVFLAAFSEFARAYADSVGYLTGNRAVSESSRVSDSAAAAGALRGYISESATGSDSIAAKFFHATFINESARALDSLNAPGSTYNATVSNSVQALDTPSAGAIFYAAVIAYAGITDLVTARYLWELIDDRQTPDWGTIDDTQSAGWVEVNDIQAASWQNVGNTQTDGWTQIDDTQDPDWVRITP
jgi:hypothetical protein